MDLTEQIDHSQWQAAAGMDIPWMLQQRVEQAPDKTCMIWCPFEGQPQSFSYAELFDAAGRLAAGLGERNVRKGSFVLLHMDNSPEFVIAWYACAMLGAVVVSTNTRSVARDMRYFADVTQAVCALTQPQYAAMINESCPQLSFLGVTDNDAGMFREDSAGMRDDLNAIDYKDLFANDPMALRAADGSENLSVQFTSGTTSRPKAVLWTHANGIWAGKTGAQHYRLSSDDVTTVFLPLFHTNAQSYSMLSTHWSGGTIVVQPRFSASRFWDVVTEHGVTWASMIPFAIRAILDQPVPEHKMRFWSLGARSHQIEDLFGLKTLGLWGMTETVSHGITVDLDHLGPELTVGRVAPGYEIQLRRKDGSLCELGETGHLFVRGVRGIQLFKEYYNNEEANLLCFDDQGWLDTGDLIRSDEEGWLYFSDRDKDMLKVGAENVAASEIETVIMLSGLVQEAAVVGQAHYMLDEVPVAFVIRSRAGEELDLHQFNEQLIEHCRSKLPDFKVIRSVHVVDELPRSTLEKIAKNVLRDRLPPITDGR